MLALFSRREFCGVAAGGLAASGLSFGLAQQAGFAQPSTERVTGMTLSIGNYGMKSHKVEEAIRIVAGLGYDGIELSMMPEWDSSPAKLSRERRSLISRLLVDSGLTLTSLMEDLTPSAVDSEHQVALDRLKLAAELGQELSPQNPPLIQTVLGGGKWTDKKELFRDRVGDWLQITKANKTVLGVKPHRSGAMSQPSEAVWLVDQLGNSPWLGMVYDYSHYAFRNLSIDETVKTAFPATIQIVAKDVINKNGQFEFALPGETNTIDHAKILSQFYGLGFRNNVCCEVSSQVFRRPDYDAASAAKTCYSYMNAAFEKSQIPRRKSK